MSAKRKHSGSKRSRKRIARLSLDEALLSSVRPDDARLDRMTDADVARQIKSNPDTMEFTDAMFANATWVEPPVKQLLSLRIDRDVLEWFRATGKNYQSRMNAVLRSYVAHHDSRRLATLGESNAASSTRRRRSVPARR